MVIVVEEHKGSKIGILNFVAWFLMIGLIIVIVYYIFFQAPATTTFPTPIELGSVNIISDIKDNLNPQKMADALAARSHTQLFPVPDAASAIKGRTNPFVPYTGFVSFGPNGGLIAAPTSTAPTSTGQ